MRKVLLLLSSLFCMGMAAQGTLDSEGTLSVSKNIVLAPGGDVDDEDGYFTIAFDAPDDKYYTAYQMDIYLPDGYVFVVPDGCEDCALMNEDGGVYPKVNRKYIHSLSTALRSNNHLFVMGKDTDKNSAFTKKSGDLFDVFIKATPYAKPGDFQVTITGIKFVAPDETKYLYQDQVLRAGTVSAESSLPLKVTSANKISTAIFPFACDIPSGLEVYATNGTDGEYIKLVQQESIEAFTPYILYAENGFDNTLNGTIDAGNYPASTSVSDGTITGVLADTEVSAGYVMQNKGDGPKFYKIGSTSFTIPAGKCYANPASAGANVRALSFLFGDEEPNAIQSQSSVSAKTQAVYDLQGKQVLDPQSGHIYIINGQKVLKR